MSEMTKEEAYAYIDALRAKVEALEQALQVQGRNAAQAAKEYAAQLAAMTAERDRLKEALRSIAVSTCCGNCREATLVAHSALRGEPGGG